VLDSWRASLQSPWPAPLQSQQVPLSPKVSMTNPFPIYFLGWILLFYFMQISPSMSRKLYLVDQQFPSQTLHDFKILEYLWISVRPVWQTGQTGSICQHWKSYLSIRLMHTWISSLAMQLSWIPVPSQNPLTAEFLLWPIWSDRYAKPVRPVYVSRNSFFGSS
jgi:hypothetical protein